MKGKKSDPQAKTARTFGREKPPAGNAKVGDSVLYAEAPAAGNKIVWHRGTVLKVGIPNSAGYPFNIRIGVIDRGTYVVSPFYHDSFVLSPYRVIIFAPPNELKPWVRGYAETQNLLIVRDPCNSDEPRYRFFCEECHQLLCIRLSSCEVASLRYDADYGFNNGKFEVDDSHTEFFCHCDDRDYAEPPGFEINY